MNSSSNAQNSGESPDSRREFFKLAIGALASLSGIVLGAPFLRAVIHSTTPKETGWSHVAELTALNVNRPQKIKFAMLSQDAYLHNEAVRSVWAIKHTGGDVTVFSPVCTHLGCYFSWNEEAGRFECPCHASVFSITGKVLGGPAPRPLDTLPYKVDNGVLFVRWEEFKSGLPEKIKV